MVLVKCGCKQNCVCVVVVAWTQSSCWIHGKNLAVQCVECIWFCVVSYYLTIKGLKMNVGMFPLQFALKKLIIISKNKYLFQSTFFIDKWNRWKCYSYPGQFFVLERPYIRGCWNCRVSPLSLTKTVHCCPKKILICVKFTVHKLTYLKK